LPYRFPKPFADKFGAPALIAVQALSGNNSFLIWSLSMFSGVAT
jgi:hypothetical protein